MSTRASTRPAWDRRTLYSLLGLFGIFSILALVTYFFVHFRSAQPTDPDYYYHLALANYMQEHPLPRTLPAVAGIGWDRKFTDKEFLFHQLTAWSYWIAGPTGVSWVPYFLLIVFFLSVWVSLAPRLSPGRIVCVMLTCLVPFYWLDRMILVRPHVLSILLAIHLCLALRQKNVRVAGVVAGLFVLSYHALYIPAIILTIYYYSTVAKKKNQAAESALKWAGVGLAGGVLIHPYFPDILILAGQLFQVALSMGESIHPTYGDEMYPWTTSDLLLNNLFTFGVMGVAIRAGQARSFLFLVAAAFWGITFLTPRGQEYSIPLTALLLGELLGKKNALDRMASFLLVVLFVAQAGQFVSYYRYKTKHQWAVRAEADEVLAALEHLPSNARGKVFNCGWQLGSFILYARPQLKFLDLLDPSFLLNFDPNLAALREDLNQGLVKNPGRLINQRFGSQYVLGTSGQAQALEDQLTKDPRFHQLVRGKVFLYELNSHYSKPRTAE